LRMIALRRGPVKTSVITLVLIPWSRIFLISVRTHVFQVHTLTPCSFKICYNTVLSFMPRSSKYFLPLRFSDQNSGYISHLLHACYMPRPSHSPLFYHHNNTWGRIQIIKLLILQSSPVSLLKSRFSPQHPLFNHPVCVLSFGCDIGRTRIQSMRLGYNFV